MRYKQKVREGKPFEKDLPLLLPPVPFPTFQNLRGKKSIVLISDVFIGRPFRVNTPEIHKNLFQKVLTPPEAFIF